MIQVTYDPNVPVMNTQSISFSIFYYNCTCIILYRYVMCIITFSIVEMIS